MQQLGACTIRGVRTGGALRQARSARGAVPARAQSAAVLRDPPYSYDALEPSMSRKTLEFHHGCVLVIVMCI
jgi:hypothetical protein